MIERILGTFGLLVAMALFGALLVAVFAAPAEPPERWRVEQCWTNDCIAATLNRLPADDAASAKLTTWNNSTYVWYRAR